MRATSFRVSLFTMLDRISRVYTAFHEPPLRRGGHFQLKEHLVGFCVSPNPSHMALAFASAVGVISIMSVDKASSTVYHKRCTHSPSTKRIRRGRLPPASSGPVLHNRPVAAAMHGRACGRRPGGDRYVVAHLIR